MYWCTWDMSIQPSVIYPPTFSETRHVVKKLITDITIIKDLSMGKK